MSNFQWMQARDGHISQIHKNSLDWPEAFTADDLAVLQFPANESNRRALKGCMLNAIKGGTLPTARLTTTRGKLPTRGPAVTGEDLRAYLRSVTASLETVEVVAIGRPAFAAFLVEQGIEPSEHVCAWLRDLPSTASAGHATSKTERSERQILAILEEAKKLSIDPLAIPRGGKGKLKEICLLRTELFTDSGFDHAWKKATAEEPPRLRVENHDVYARK